MRETARIVSVVCVLAGCTSTGGGQSMMITEDTALISAPGRARETRAELLGRAMREAAVMTRAQGFRYFVVMDAEPTAEVIKRRRPGTTIPAQNIPVRGSFSGTNLSPSFLAGATYTTPDEVTEETRAGLDLTIRMYRDGGIDPATAGACDIIATRETPKGGPENLCNLLK